MLRSPSGGPIRIAGRSNISGSSLPSCRRPPHPKSRRAQRPTTPRARPRPSASLATSAPSRADGECGGDGTEGS